MKLRWHEQARAEADAAADFYKDKQPSLAIRYLDSLEDALHRIQRYPQAYRQVEQNLRKCRVTHFPYGIIYRVQADFVEIIAVMHLRREPGYWRKRG